MKTLSETQQRKNNLIIYGFKEKIIPIRIKREKKET